jgi:hypothetical protein
MDMWPGRIPDGDALVKAALQHDVIQRSPLVRVVAIGKSAAHDGVVLELLALEIRDAGAILHWKARPVGEYVLGGPDFVISDDVGTAYTLLQPTWVSSEGMVKGNTDLVPPPPVDAETMRIEVQRLGGLGASVPRGLVRDEPVEGRWSFDFRLD